MRPSLGQRLLIYAILLMLVLVYISPIYWTLITSFKKLPEMMASTPTFFPEDATLQHYRDVLYESRYTTFMRNSIVVGVAATVLTLLLSVGAAYSLSRLRFRGKTLFSLGILLVYLFPGILLIIPLFRVMANLGLYDNIISVVLVHVILALPFGIWTLRSFFDGVPVELEDAARIDGASRLRVLAQIFTPLIAPGIATVAIFSFVVSWNDYLFPAILLSSPSNQTVPVGIAGWTSAYSINWGQISAASILTVVPVIFFFGLVGRYFVQGLAAGAVKE
ncbi:MAG: carbohydrate ABC transporter permease [Anaerolineae bacterium]|nr:carbohydrate ABC transporter permease [Anaerolineae bacterium]